MEEVKAFKTSDGQIFEDKEAATEHQNKVTLREELSRIVDEFHTYSMRGDDIVNGLLEHVPALKRLFNEHA